MGSYNFHMIASEYKKISMNNGNLGSVKVKSKEEGLFENRNGENVIRWYIFLFHPLRWCYRHYD